MASSKFNVVKNNLNSEVYKGNLDNLVDGGVYTVTGTDITNGPADMAGTGNLMILSNSSLLIHQVIFVGNTIVYIRRCAHGGWSGWAKTTLTPVT